MSSTLASGQPAAVSEGTPTRNWASRFRPELELLLCAGRTRTDPVSRDRFRALLRNGLNWDDVAAAAAWHRLSAVLYDSIDSTARDLVSAEQQQMLENAVRASGANALALAGELLRLNQRFESAQIPAIPYKGPVLATLAYGNLARREYADLDFALPQRYIPEANALLQAAGYRSLFDHEEAHAGENGFAPGQYTFLSARQEILIELHTERTLRYYPTPVDFGDLTSRLICVEIAGQSLRTFSVEDTLVMLSVHGAKHFWERLFWILDLSQLIAARPLDWTLLYEVAERMESTRLLLLGLSLAHDLFNAPLPDPVLRDARGDKQVRLLAEDVLGRYAGIPGPGNGVWPRTVFRVRSRDKFWQGLSHTIRLGMSPTESDRQNVRLPRFLAPLYMLLRPWRLFREYGLGSKPRPKGSRK